MNTRSTIVGNDGASQETQQEFLVLFESTILENSISTGIQRYQFAVQNAKVKLDYAVAYGCWLLPSNLLVNSGSVVGYNNKLVRATKNMKFGVNNINNETIKKNTDDMGGTKVKLPHKTNGKTTTPEIKHEVDKHEVDKKSKHVSKNKSEKHENNLAMITIGAIGLAWYVLR